MIKQEIYIAFADGYIFATLIYLLLAIIVDLYLKLKKEKEK